MGDAARVGGAPEPEGEVRARLLGLLAALLPTLDPVPPRLRRIAAFAPARRARLGGEQVLAAVLDDDGLRERLAAAASDPAPEVADDPATAAARAWLVRGDGWEATWATATAALAQRQGRAAAEREQQDVRRAEERADRAQAALEEHRAEARRRADELREEVTTLRRRLGETRAREREARAETEEARDTLATVRREVQEARTEAEAERRRLRGRVQELEDANAALRRADRGERDEVGLRLRVLLDTVTEAAAGLRRELVLPSTAGSAPGSHAGPGERVERALADRAAGSTEPGPVREGAAALEQYLAAPRSRLLVDGYNVSKTAWPEATLEDQRARLLRLLAPVVARTGAETTVVFDAAATQARPVVPGPRGVRVVFSPYGVIADDVIAELVEAEPEGRPVVVVSSDAEVARHAARHAARAVASTSLLALLA